MVRNRGSDFLRDERGYVMVLALIAMPLMLGFSLLVIDVARGNNLHTDLQNAVDALALAGARELDGGVDSTDRADAVIAAMLNNQARFGDSGPEIVDETKVTVTYLTAIPPTAGGVLGDDRRIDAAWIAANTPADQTEANYVLVRSLERPITSIWPVPVSWTNSTVNMQAEAVATYTASACDVTPLFICNPYENDPVLTFDEEFNDGAFYARQLTMSMESLNNAGPGNYGFLRVGGKGAEVLGHALATGNPGACYSTKSIDTEPGKNVGQVENGLNVRFDLYGGAFNKVDTNPAYRPAFNVRKGSENASECKSYSEETDGVNAMAFPTGAAEETLDGGTLHSADWETDLLKYWKINHPADYDAATDTVNIPDIPSKTNPAGDLTVWPPSRYDIYQYEIAEKIRGANSDPNPTGHRAKNGEKGEPMCYRTPADITTDEDRRVIFAAVVNCEGAALKGSDTVLAGDIEGFISMFLTKPMIAGSTKTISAEILDYSGYSGNNTLDLFLREESVLVR